jgi:hypothetical protein
MWSQDETRKHSRDQLSFSVHHDDPSHEVSDDELHERNGLWASCPIVAVSDRAVRSHDRSHGGIVNLLSG